MPVLYLTGFQVPGLNFHSNAPHTHLSQRAAWPRMKNGGWLGKGRAGCRPSDHVRQVEFDVERIGVDALCCPAPPAVRSTGANPNTLCQTHRRNLKSRVGVDFQADVNPANMPRRSFPELLSLYSHIRMITVRIKEGSPPPPDVRNNVPGIEQVEDT